MSIPSEPNLEAAIRANRSDPAPYLVYADWLQSKGSPLGELIVLQHELSRGESTDKRARAEEIIRGLELPPSDLATFGWRNGLWSWLRLENSRDWMDGAFDAVELARRTFGSPACRVLEELRVGVLRWEYNSTDVPAVLEEAARHAWAADLASLHLGDVDENVDMGHHAIGVVGERISRAFPNLTSLRVHSSEQSWDGDATFGLAGIELPRLRELAIETCSMSKARTAEVLAARLPQLFRLELWFGSEDYGADTVLDDLLPLLSGSVFSGVSDLGLRNAGFANDIARGVATSSIAGRLERFDISMGTLEDEGARELAANAKRFTALKALDVSDNFLTPEGIAALRSAFAGIDVVSSSQKDIDGDWRYVTVAE